MLPSLLNSDERIRAADLFEACHEEVVGRLLGKYPSVDAGLLYNSFVNAVLEIAEHPEKFDASRGTTIANFLYGASRQWLRTMRRSELRLHDREQKKAEMLVAKRASAARHISDHLADAEEAAKFRSLAAHSDEERDVLRLWELDYTDEEIARELQIDLSHARLVRDRVLQRARRAGKKENDA